MGLMSSHATMKTTRKATQNASLQPAGSRVFVFFFEDAASPKMTLKREARLHLDGTAEAARLRGWSSDQLTDHVIDHTDLLH